MIVCLDAYSIYPVDAPRWEAVRSLDASVVLYERTAPSQIIERAKDAEIVLTNKVPFDAKTIASLPKLKYIGILATGYNIVDIQAAKEAGVIVTNIPSYSTYSVAQHTFALLLALTNRVETYSQSVFHGDWCSCADFTFRLNDWVELEGKTMGIVGYGNIGSHVAAIASAMGMNVALYTSKPQELLPQGYIKMNLDELFAKCDVISLHCPLTDSTRGMVNAERISLMKPSAILLNTARGPLVDEHALAQALIERRIGGAGLDVLTKEPPCDGSPLFDAPNCVITPHMAWASAQARERLLKIAVDNVRAFQSGKPVNIVNS